MCLYNSKLFSNWLISSAPCLFWDRVLLCSPGRPWTPNPPAWASWMLRSVLCTITAGSFHLFFPYLCHELLNVCHWIQAFWNETVTTTIEIVLFDSCPLEFWSLGRNTLLHFKWMEHNRRYWSLNVTCPPWWLFLVFNLTITGINHNPEMEGTLAI